MCAMTSILYGWDLRNIAKLDQGTANYEVFRSIVLKTVVTIRTKFSTVILTHIEVLSETPYDSNENFYSHFTLYWGPMCAMTSRPYGCDLRNMA